MTLPKPPSAITISAVTVYGSPIDGEISNTIESSAPAAPASARPTPKTAGCNRRPSIPTSRAPVGDCIIARTARPSRVARNTKIRPRPRPIAPANATSRFAVNPTPATDTVRERY